MQAAELSVCYVFSLHVPLKIVQFIIHIVLCYYE